MTLEQPVEANSKNVTVKPVEKKAVQPTAWKPGVVFDGLEGEITSRPTSEVVPQWDDIIKSWGYDPEEFEIVEPVKISTWEAQTPDGVQQLWSYKAGLRARTTARSISYDDLIAEVKRHRPLNTKTPDGEYTFLVLIADTQFGKADGDGLDGTIARFIQMIDDVERRIRDLRLMGRSLGHLCVVGMGDIIEGCNQNYPNQAFTVEANRREQIRIARRLVRDALARWSKLFKRVTVSAVPGNHGENRLDGRMFTDYGDNDDVSVFEIVAEILNENPEAYKHVEFLLPINEITVTLDLSGVITAFNHGHFAKGGNSPQARQRAWWEDQSFGEQPAGDARLLFTAHYHHTSVVQYGKKCHFQCPAMDGGSTWYTNISGSESPPGTLTIVVGKDVSPSGWSDLQII